MNRLRVRVPLAHRARGLVAGGTVLLALTSSALGGTVSSASASSSYDAASTKTPLTVAGLIPTELATGTSAMALNAAGNRLYLADAANQVGVLKVQPDGTAGDITFLHRFDARIYDLALNADETELLVSAVGTLSRLSTGSPSTPSPMAPRGEQLVTVGDRTYAASTSWNWPARPVDLAVVDSNPDSPSYGTTLESWSDGLVWGTGGIGSMEASSDGKWLYVTRTEGGALDNSSAVDVWDVDPASPSYGSIQGTIDIPDGIDGPAYLALSESGDRLYAAGFAYDCCAIRVYGAVPDAPAFGDELDRFQFDGGTGDLVRSGSVLYMADASGVAAVDIAPRSPTYGQLTRRVEVCAGSDQLAGTSDGSRIFATGTVYVGGSGVLVVDSNNDGGGPSITTPLPGPRLVDDQVTVASGDTATVELSANDAANNCPIWMNGRYVSPETYDFPTLNLDLSQVPDGARVRLNKAAWYGAIHVDVEVGSALAEPHFEVPYTIANSDGRGAARAGVLKVDVTGIATPPKASDDSVTLAAGEQRQLNVTDNDAWSGAATVTFDEVNSDSVDFVDTGQGAAIVTAGSNSAAQSLDVPYTLTDDTGLTDTAVLHVTVVPFPDEPPTPAGPPEAKDDSITVDAGQLARLNVTDNDTWAGNADITFGEGDSDTVELLGNGTGAVTVSAAADAAAESIEVPYTLTDSTGRSDTAMLLVTVNPATDQPTQTNPPHPPHPTEPTPANPLSPPTVDAGDPAPVARVGVELTWLVLAAPVGLLGGWLLLRRRRAR